MKQYIDKEAVAAEIKKRFDEYSSSILKHYDACKEAKAQELGKILTILDTLEEKEVDLDFIAIAMPSDSSIWVNHDDLSNLEDGDNVEILIIKK